MDILYCKEKSKKITEQILQVEEQINKYQAALEKLSQQHIFLQGSLAVVNELITFEESERGGSCENS